MSFIMKVFFGSLLLCVILVIYRLSMGPTAPDRAVALDILGIILLNICVLLSIIRKKDFYVTVGIVIAIINFVVSLALAKFLEGKNYNE